MPPQRASPKLPRAVLPCCDRLLPCFAPSGVTGRGAWRGSFGEVRGCECPDACLPIHAFLGGQQGRRRSPVRTDQFSIVANSPTETVDPPKPFFKVDRLRRSTNRKEPMPTHSTFDPIALDFTKVSDHWAAEVEAFRRQGPRWTTPRYQAATRNDTERAPEFNHKATHVMRSGGFSQPASAKVLGITDRAVRSYLSRPCKALEAECKEVAWRDRVSHHEATKRGRAPFDVWAYLREVEPPLVAALLGFNPWVKEDTGSTTRERVAFYLMDGWSQAETARMLCVSKQAVSKHAAAIKEKVGTQVRKRRRLFKVEPTRKL